MQTLSGNSNMEIKDVIDSLRRELSTAFSEMVIEKVSEKIEKVNESMIEVKESIHLLADKVDKIDIRVI